MSDTIHDLSRIASVAAIVAGAEVSAAALASSMGTATDPLGQGEHWTVARPELAGVHSIVVISSADRGPAGLPHLVMFAFAKGTGPHLHEVEEVFGTGMVVEPLDWEPWRLVYDGPATEAASVKIIVSTDAVTGDERDPMVTEIALRRDHRG